MEKEKQDPSLPFDPTAMSWLLQERLMHVAQWGSAIFFIICCQKTYYDVWDSASNICREQVEHKTQHGGRGVKQRQRRYLFFNKAVEGQLFLHSVASVDHQTRVCRAESSQAGRWAFIL